MIKAHYLYENIGKYGPEWSKKNSLYLYENIGKYGPEWSKKNSLYLYETVTSDPPFPTIDRLSNYSGFKGSSVKIYGSGFGFKPESDPTNTDRRVRGYGGKVYIGDSVCGIVSWSWTEIVVSIPSDAISGAIKVTLTTPVPPGIRHSNMKGFEVLESTSSKDTGLELFICDKLNPNTILCQLDGASEKSFQMLMNNPGSGSFSISRYDEKIKYIQNQNLVLCRLNGVDRFKWIIEGINYSYVNSDEQQMVSVSGRGLMSILDRAVVYPPIASGLDLERSWTDTNAGNIFRQLLNEAKTRGGLSDIVLDWPTDYDSIGEPWTDLTDISFHVGTPLLEVGTRFSDAMGIFVMDISPTGRLKLYIRKAEELSKEVRYFPGQAVLNQENQNDTSKMTNIVLVEGDEGGLLEVSNQEALANWGRREGYLQARNIPNKWAKLEAYGGQYLKTTAVIDWSIQATVIEHVDIDGNRLLPFENYKIGDWIGWYVSPEGDSRGFNNKVRVKGITVRENESGMIDYTLDINNIRMEREIKINQKVERLSSYSSSSSMSSPSTSVPASAAHNHTHATLRGLSQDDHPQYLNVDRHASNPHDFITRVSSIKGLGRNHLTGEITITAGNNVTISQDDDLKLLTISATGGSGGGGGGGLPNRIYTPRGIDVGYDDEFNDGFLSSSWSKVDVTGAEMQWFEPDGIKGLSFVAPPTAAWNVRGIMKSIEGLNYPYYIETAIKGFSGNISFPTIGLCLSTASTYNAGSQLIYGPVYNNRAFIACTYDNFKTRTWLNEKAWLAWATAEYFHLRIYRITANTYRVYTSIDGVIWHDLYGVITNSINPTYAGIVYTGHDSNPVMTGNIAYFRVRNGDTSDLNG